MGKPPETTHFAHRYQRPVTCGFANGSKTTSADSLAVEAGGLHAKGRLSFKTGVSAKSSLQRRSAAPFGTKTKTQNTEFEKSFWSCPSFCPRSRRNKTWCYLAAFGSRRHRKLGATRMTGRQIQSHRVGVEQTFDKIIYYQIAGTVSIESVPAAVCMSLHAQYAP